MSAVVPGLLYSASGARLRIVLVCVRAVLNRACRRRRGRGGEDAHRSSVAAADRDSAPQSGQQRRSSWLGPGEREVGGTELLSLSCSYGRLPSCHTSERNRNSHRRLRSAESQSREQQQVGEENFRHLRPNRLTRQSRKRTHAHRYETRAQMCVCTQTFSAPLQHTHTRSDRRTCT